MRRPYDRELMIDDMGRQQLCLLDNSTPGFTPLIVGTTFLRSRASRASGNQGTPPDQRTEQHNSTKSAEASCISSPEVVRFVTRTICSGLESPAPRR